MLTYFFEVTNLQLIVFYLFSISYTNSIQFVFYSNNKSPTLMRDTRQSSDEGYTKNYVKSERSMKFMETKLDQ